MKTSADDIRSLPGLTEDQKRDLLDAMEKAKAVVRSEAGDLPPIRVTIKGTDGAVLRYEESGLAAPPKKEPPK